jgi:hypothetical protein
VAGIFMLDRKYTKDGVHLLNNGYEEWKKIIIPIINNEQ